MAKACYHSCIDHFGLHAVLKVVESCVGDVRLVNDLPAVLKEIADTRMIRPHEFIIIYKDKTTKMWYAWDYANKCILPVSSSSDADLLETITRDFPQLVSNADTKERAKG